MRFLPILQEVRAIGTALNQCKMRLHLVARDDNHSLRQYACDRLAMFMYNVH